MLWNSQLLDDSLCLLQFSPSLLLSICSVAYFGIKECLNPHMLLPSNFLTYKQAAKLIAASKNGNFEEVKVCLNSGTKVDSAGGVRYHFSA